MSLVMTSELLVPARLRLQSPPRVVSAGVSLHGTRELVERWLLPDLCAVHVYSYRGEVEVDGVVHQIRPGSLSIIPAGSFMEFRYVGVSEHVYAHLQLPTTGPAVDAPIMQHLGDEAPAIRGRLQAAALLSDSAHQAAELWSILWLAVDRGRRPQLRRGGDHPAVRAAVAYIEGNLARSLTVPGIARAALVSVSHLNRLFRAAFDSGVTGYVRDRRVERAEHLLRNTTQPIGLIASTLGIPDLQAFNKLCRSRLGGSPRAVRERRPPRW